MANYFLEFIVRLGVEIIYLVACTVRGAINDVQVMVENVVILRIELVEGHAAGILPWLCYLMALLERIGHLLPGAFFVVVVLLDRLVP